MENTEYIRKRDAIDMCGGYTELAYAMAGIESDDVVPVMHGKWKKIGVWGRVYRCSQCGNFLDFDAVNAGNRKIKSRLFGGFGFEVLHYK